MCRVAKFPGREINFPGLVRTRSIELSVAVLTSCDRQCNCSVSATAMNGSGPPRCVAWTTPTCTRRISLVTFDVCSMADWSLITDRWPDNSMDLMLLWQSRGLRSHYSE